MTSRRRDVDRGKYIRRTGVERVKVSGSMRPRPGTNVGRKHCEAARRFPASLLLVLQLPSMLVDVRMETRCFPALL